MIKDQKNTWILSVVFLALGVILMLLIFAFGENKHAITSWTIVIIKLLDFFLILIAVIFFPRHWFKPPWNLILIFLAYAIIVCYFIPKLFFYYYKEQGWDQYYLLTQYYVTYIILSLALAFYLGGVKRKDVFVFGSISVLFMKSGIEDLCYILVNPKELPGFEKFPEVWNWAYHMTVFIGRPATKYEAFVYIAIHFILIILIILFAYVWNDQIKTLINNVLIKFKKHN